jgi:Voltage gated chloride channel
MMALAVPQGLGTGYGWVQVAMTAAVLTVPLWVILVLPFAKIVATSLSIGSGGSGRIFGPGMVIGGFLGAAVWRLAHDLPAVAHSPAPFVVVGMIACFGSITHAPLAVMLMVAELRSAAPRKRARLVIERGGSDAGAVHVGLLARGAPQGAVPVRAGVQMVLVVFAGDRSADRALPAVREATALRAEQRRLHRHHALRAASTPRNAQSAPTAKIAVAR